MHILGISCFYHDAATVLLEDGMLVAAAEEERFTRQKHDFSFPRHAIEFCLKQAGIRGEDLDYAVFYEKPLLKFERILMTCLAGFPRTWSVFRESMIAWFNEKLWIKNHILDRLGISPEKLLFVEHHLSHAASAFFCSPYEEAAILTCDGVGEWTTAALGQARADWDGTGRNQIELFREVKFPHSLGLLYSAFTAYLGFRVNNGEYKVMGMAAYGEPGYLDQVYSLIEVGDDGGFRLNMDYFSFHTSAQRAFNGRFVELFGPPRIRGAEFFTPKTHPDRDGARARENQRYADIAASIQHATEEALLKMARHAYERTGLKQLCVAGGVALNCVANGRILTETPFEDVYIQPAAGDSGGALGAALYAHHVLLGKPRRFILGHCFWGQEYSVDEMRAALDGQGFSYLWVEDEEQLTDVAVDALVEGKVVGWYNGRFEWGPRALGNRSILADPRRAEMKEVIARIKLRQPFLPFAPVVLEEQAGEYFDLCEPARHYPARYMLLVRQIHEDKRAVIPAVTHINGSGRLQTIRREWNPRYCRVVEKFREATGVPVLLNTSLNLRGEPIVNTPQNALDTFGRSGIDLLVMDRFVVTKDG
jgi:carbamoyltransferase